jgi:gas vesicle protein
MARENPLGLAIGAVAAGFVAGMLIPSTRVEDERLGPVADNVKQQAREVSSEAADHAKQLAQDVAETATETVKEEGPQHAQELRESVTGTTR